jgi:hypothetical protein
MRKTSVIGIIAGLMTIISIFLPILKGIKSSTLQDYLKETGDSSLHTIFFTVSVLLLLSSFLANKKHLFSILTLLASSVILLLAYIFYGAITKSYGADNIGYGIYVMALAGVLGVVSSFLGFMKK